MTHDEMDDLIQNVLSGLWSEWKATPAEIELVTQRFLRYDYYDVKSSMQRHREKSSRKVPMVGAIKTELYTVIAERKSKDKVAETATVWPGQVFLVLHRDGRGEIDGIWSFHVPNIGAEVPAEYTERRMSQHIEHIAQRLGGRYPTGFFGGEVMDEAMYAKRLGEIRRRDMELSVKPVPHPNKPLVEKKAAIFADAPELDDSIPF
jgi:hypothetical protein